VTLANKITIGRLAFIPVFLACVAMYSREAVWYRYAALATFAAAGISDAIDGYVARRYNQHTHLGKRLDPLADKLLINLAFVFLAVNTELLTPIPKWIPVIVLARDVVIVVGAYLIHERRGAVVVAPRTVGKATTWAQMISIVAVLLELNPWFVKGLLYVTVALTVASLLVYVRDGIEQAGKGLTPDGSK
jgi:cardiolipin synthase